MISPVKQAKSWQETLSTLRHPRVITMFFFGISAGLPLLLIFSSLSLWLREAGVDRAMVTYFSWAALGYSFKFVWAPMVDRMALPVLTSLLGRRRAWLLLSQLMVISAICLTALIDPATEGLVWMAWAAVFLGFSSATQDIVLDAYRIESAAEEWQALLSSSYIAGYRIGMLIAGAGALFIASYWGSTLAHYDYTAWRGSYLLMASLMLTGVITTLIIKEPEVQTRPELIHSKQDYLAFYLLLIVAVSMFIAGFYFTADWPAYIKHMPVSSVINPVLAGMLAEAVRFVIALALSALTVTILVKLEIVSTRIAVMTYLAPVQDFFDRYGIRLAWLLLALIGLYRISDIVLGVIANVFYQDMGFTKVEIATVVKTFGLFMTIAGGFLGGLLAVRYGVIRILFLGALLSAVTNLLFMVLAYLGHNLPMLYIVISADNLSAGLASAAFIAFLSSLTNISFTAMQYAIFSSLMTLLPKILGGYSGSMVDALGYPRFFLLTTLLGIPVLLLIGWANKHFDFKEVTIK